MSRQTHAATGPRSSIDPADVERFSRIAAEWWDPKGKFAPLHKFNPVRLGFIRDQALYRFNRDPAARRPFEGLRLLDIGCGGGLLCEPMTRLGFAVTGVDASERNIGTASAHAAQQGLEIDYRASTAEALLAAGEPPFDLILNMEVIEHVADPGAFLRDCAKLLKPGGLMIVATLNRTLKAFALAKVGAEYVLRWLPAGTHDWSQFLKPEELRGFLAEEDVTVDGPFGVAYDPLSGRWSQSHDTDVNYMMTVGRSAA
ncbi:MAG TPA: bifunctional 2-polyprenyl-6-hydroxyphenol methylase/3-demethylubiquinol 3-O-methyltransferase UbiG [Phenylobacterium sp.]|nr:bifunctional 2-polyprenyl-6-hydroxyphenol methylase/3-demethylubiquinol 3-O-methyltransferase UbiG [Phenylobacterium sp.]